jgi:anti-sigma regulatory factor (Ser/Thr protein kinase)
VDELSVNLPATNESPALARRALRSMATMEGELLERATLLVSELVTNGVRHGGSGKIRLHVRRIDDDVIRVEVLDTGDGFVPTPGVRDQQPLEPGGWGLVLVERLADRWGVESDGETLVWFELRADAADEAA